MTNKALIERLRSCCGIENEDPECNCAEAADALEAREWNPDMSAAPKDGTPILVRADRTGWTGNPRTVCVQWYKEADRWYIYGAGPTRHSEQWLDECSPTAWQHLPTPPEDTVLKNEPFVQ